ncbi:hypothetical protein [Streptomyces sp. NPDC056883]|uniref:hypothetical protein n=1 Tax=Streptomyces sp. NPDC056883 TaxID=3345959 RepID=UPI0036BDD111
MTTKSTTRNERPRPALEIHLGGMHLTVERVPYWLMTATVMTLMTASGITITWN